MRSRDSKYGGIGGDDEQAPVNRDRKQSADSTGPLGLCVRAGGAEMRGLFQLDDGLIRFYIVPFDSQDGLDGSVNRSRHAAFHLHRLDDQEWIAGFHPIVY